MKSGFKVLAIQSGEVVKSRTAKTRSDASIREDQFCAEYANDDALTTIRVENAKGVTIQEYDVPMPSDAFVDGETIKLAPTWDNMLGADDSQLDESIDIQEEIDGHVGGDELEVVTDASTIATAEGVVIAQTRHVTPRVICKTPSGRDVVSLCGELDESPYNGDEGDDVVKSAKSAPKSRDRFCEATGTHVHKSTDGGKFITTCVEHGTSKEHDTARRMRHESWSPQKWCAECAESLKTANAA